MENSSPHAMYVETLKSKADDYIENVVDRGISYYRRRSFRSNVLYNGAKITLLILSLSLPALSAILKENAPRLLAALSMALRVAIAVLAALEGRFREPRAEANQRRIPASVGSDNGR